MHRSGGKIPTDKQAPERSCGDCTLCCKVMAVDAIKKPANKWCQHVCKAGCEIYEERPQDCIDFECGWLQGAFEDRDRPDKVKVVFDSGYIKGAPLVIARESYSGAARRGRGKRLVNVCVNLGMAVIIINHESGFRKAIVPAGQPRLKAIAQGVMDGLGKIARGEDPKTMDGKTYLGSKWEWDDNQASP